MSPSKILPKSFRLPGFQIFMTLKATFAVFLLQPVKLLTDKSSEETKKALCNSCVIIGGRKTQSTRDVSDIFIFLQQ